LLPLFSLSVSKEAWVLFALKKKGKEREEGKEKYLYPYLNIYISIPSPHSEFSKFKRGMNSIQRSHSRIRYPPLPFLHPLPSLLFYLPLIHYIPYIPYTCIS
jgi:hypothetical protein